METEILKLKLKLCKKLDKINARISYKNELKPRENKCHYLAGECIKLLKERFSMDIQKAILHADISLSNYKSEVLLIIDKIQGQYESDEKLDFGEIVAEVKRKMKLVEEPK